MNRFSDFFQKNYDKLKDACQKVCQKNKETFDEDIFHDTFIKIHNIREKKGELEDETDTGLSNYFVRSFVNNSRCLQRNSWLKKRDANSNEETLKDKLLDSPAQQKLRSDLYIDFSTLYLLKVAEDTFPPDDFNLFKMKYLCGMTYKAIAEKMPNEKKVRTRILAIKNYLKNNVSKKEIDAAFTDFYGFLL